MAAEVVEVEAVPFVPYDTDAILEYPTRGPRRVTVLDLTRQINVRRWAPQFLVRVLVHGETEPRDIEARRLAERPPLARVGAADSIEYSESEPEGEP